MFSSFEPRKAVIGLAILLVILIVLASVLFVVFSAVWASPFEKDRASAIANCFDAVVVRTLLPMFNLVGAAILAYIFGKPLVAAIASRIAAGRTTTAELDIQSDVHQ